MAEGFARKAVAATGSRTGCIFAGSGLSNRTGRAERADLRGERRSMAPVDAGFSRGLLRADEKFFYRGFGSRNWTANIDCQVLFGGADRSAEYNPVGGCW